MNRVLVLVPFALDQDGLDRRAEQQIRAGRSADVTYEYRPVRAGPTSFVSPHDWLLLDLAILDAGKHAEDEGFDAVVIDTVSDSGSDALRSLLRIPVIAPGRASMIFALTLGRRFGVLAQWQPSLARYEKVLDEWNLRTRCAGIEHFDTAPDFDLLLTEKGDDAILRMEAACVRLIERGSDVIILGSTTMHGAHGHLSSVIDVPIIDPGPLSYKLTEACLALGLAHSRVAYPAPGVEKVAMIDAMMRAAADHARLDSSDDHTDG